MTLRLPFGGRAQRRQGLQRGLSRVEEENDDDSSGGGGSGATNSTKEVKDKEMDHERWPNIEFGLVAEKEPSRSPTCVLVVGLAVLAVCATCAALLAFHASQP